MPQECPQATALLHAPEFRTQPQERLTVRQFLPTKLKAGVTDRPFQPITPLVAEELQTVKATPPQDREGALAGP